MSVSLMLLSLLCTMIVTFFHKDHFFTINFFLIVLLYISFLNFFSSIPDLLKCLDNINLSVINKKLIKDIYNAIIKNRTLIQENLKVKHEAILEHLKNAALTVSVALLKNDEKLFNSVIEDLNNIGLTKDVIEKYKTLPDLINLIENHKVELIVNFKDKKLQFKDVENLNMNK